MWMNRLVTLSNEWKTSELRQVMIALAMGPVWLAAMMKQAELAQREEVAADVEDRAGWEDPKPD